MTSARFEPAIPVIKRPQTYALHRMATGNGCRWYIYFFHGSTGLVDQGLLTVEASGSHSRHATLGRTPLDEWSARCRHLYLTTQTLTRDRHPCCRRDSSPRSQQRLHGHELLYAQYVIAVNMSLRKSEEYSRRHSLHFTIFLHWFPYNNRPSP
jgi:hypothetical protein